VGAACMAVTGLLYSRGYVESWELHPGYSVGSVFYEALRALNTCAWVFFYLALGMRFLKAGPRLLAHANEGLLPFYALHQVVIVVVGLRAVPRGINPRRSPGSAPMADLVRPA